MQNNTNSIDNYRQQIQKRISQLQNKLKSRNGTRIQQYKDNNQKLWQEDYNLKDQPIKNRIINSINLSGQKNQMKISQNKGLEISRHRRIKENEKFQKNIIFQKERTNQNNNYINERQAKSPIKNSHKKQQNRASNKKQECMDELYEMMNKILQGQKNIEMEIIQLKNDVSKDCTLRKVSEIELSKENQILKEKQNYKDDFIENFKVGCKTNVIKKKQYGIKGNNNTFKKRSYSTRKNKKQNENDLTELMELVRNQRRKGERIIVGEELTANIWKDIEMRIMQSQRQYKDTIHRNNKHEHEHLINTYQLQKKLKDQLIQKIYQQCNQGIYK